MSRDSLDVIDPKTRTVFDGYDYSLQVWVRAGVIQDCNHPDEMKKQHCCNAHKLAGRKLIETQGHEVRP